MKSRFIHNRRRLAASALILLVVFFPSCRTVEPEVSEYRYFDDYGGYIPIDGDWYQARADHVVPVVTEGGLEDYRLPASKEEALRRVKEHSWSELHPVVAVPLYVIAIIPALILSPIIWAVAASSNTMVSEELEEMLEEFDPFGGIEVEINVSDQADAPIPGARIVEVPAFLTVGVFLDAEGRRSFAPPGKLTYEFPSSMTELLVEHFPVSTGRTKVEVTYQRDSYSEHLEQTIGGDPWHSRYTDEAGKVLLVSRAAIRFAQLDDDEEWEWACAPEMVEIRFIVWAAGYRPEIFSVSGLPLKRYVLNAQLEDLPDGAQDKEAARRLEKANRSIGESVIDSWFFLYDGKLDTVNARMALESLERIANDESVAGYLRWDARRMIADFARLVRDLENKAGVLNKSEYDSVARQAERALDELEGNMQGCSPFFRDSTRNPWSWSDDLGWWLHDYWSCYHYSGSSAVGDATEETKTGWDLYVEDARDLLSRGMEIDPGHPLLNTLRAVIAHSENKWDEALAYSRHMHHDAYFRIMHEMGVMFTPHEAVATPGLKQWYLGGTMSMPTGTVDR